MENLTIKATKYTPEVEFDYDKNELSIKGESYPENTAEFYAPIFSWIRNYLASEHQNETKVNFEIIYFNSSTSKVFMDFFDLLDQKAEEGFPIIVNWRYIQEDDNMLEYGEEFKEDVEHVKFNLVPVE